MILILLPLSACVRVNVIKTNNTLNFIYIVPIDESIVYVSVPSTYTGHLPKLLHTVANEFCLGQYSTTGPFRFEDGNRYLIECKVKQQFILDYYSIVPFGQ